MHTGVVRYDVRAVSSVASVARAGVPLDVAVRPHCGLWTYVGRLGQNGRGAVCVNDSRPCR